MIPTRNNPRLPLKVITAPGIGHVLSAPPALTASTNTVDYTCGKCGTVLMHAELGQVCAATIKMRGQRQSG